MKEKIRRIEFISKILLVFLCSIPFYGIFFNPKNEYKIFCFGNQIDNIVYSLPLIVLIILAIALEIKAILIRRKQKLSISNSIKTFLNFLFFSLMFYLLAYILLSTPCGHTGEAIDARKKGDLKRIHQAQEMFFSDKGRYAISLEELFKETEGVNVDAMLDEIEKYNIIFQEGEGLKTWKAYVYLKEYCIEICSLNKPKTIYICDEKGCRENVLTNKDILTQ